MADSTLTKTDESSLRALAEQLGVLLRANEAELACAESCTGGWLAKVITDIPGSSEWFAASVVSYSNAAKQSLLGVPENTLRLSGAVSAETVMAMCDGLIRVTDADVVISISGIAGPGGGTEDKPVGLVWLGWGLRDEAVKAESYNFAGDREEVRQQAVAQALENLINLYAH